MVILLLLQDWVHHPHYRWNPKWLCLKIFWVHNFEAIPSSVGYTVTLIRIVWAGTLQEVSGAALNIRSLDALAHWSDDHVDMSITRDAPPHQVEVVKWIMLSLGFIGYPYEWKYTCALWLLMFRLSPDRDDLAIWLVLWEMMNTARQIRSGCTRLVLVQGISSVEVLTVRCQLLCSETYVSGVPVRAVLEIRRPTIWMVFGLAHFWKSILLSPGLAESSYTVVMSCFTNCTVASSKRFQVWCIMY